MIRYIVTTKVHFLKYGAPSIKFVYYGPFDDYDDAVLYGDNKNDDKDLSIEDWWIDKLEKP